MKSNSLDSLMVSPLTIRSQILVRALRQYTHILDILCCLDSGAVGTTGRLLKDIMPDNRPLIAVSIIITAVFSALLLFSFDLVESCALITLLGGGLVILTCFASIGFALMVGINS